MKENNDLTCNTCGYKFEEVLASQLKSKLKEDFDKELSEKEKSFQEREQKIAESLSSLEKKETEVESIISQRLKSERENISNKIADIEKREAEIETTVALKVKNSKDQLEKQLETSIQKDFQERLDKLSNELQLKRKENLSLKSIEVENEKLKNDLDEQRIKIESEFEKKRKEDRKILAEQLKQSIQDDYELKIGDKDQLIKTLTNQINILKKKSEQGSMQQQGEVLEILVEEILRDAHHFDKIEEIKKGQHGADILQTVINNTGTECGKILYECKRAKNFGKDWIDKLKSDALDAKAELKVLVTEVLPDENERISIVDGICICKYQDVRGVSFLLRERLLSLSFLTNSQMHKGEKMQMLYDYLISEEFKMQLTSLIEGFSELQQSYIDEKKKMHSLWKQREKQLEKILIGTTSFYGAIRGIAGASAPRIELLESTKLQIQLQENSEPKRRKLKNAVIDEDVEE
jgi:hypothetical protein